MDASKVWKVTETLIKVTNDEPNLERKKRLIKVIDDLKNIHQSYMDDLMAVSIDEIKK